MARTARAVTVIPSTINPLTRMAVTSVAKRRVAGYARVSTDSDEQFTSYEAQIDYYTQYIKRHAEWQFVKVYTDEGISGTNMKKRDGFNQMIQDALDGKIDLIVTKSVSRFARNTVDSLVTVRKLKEKGVDVYFEKENIYTLDSKGELLITIMSSLAQEESRSISENVTWGQRKRFSDGKVSLPYKQFLGYEKGPDVLDVHSWHEFIKAIMNAGYLSGDLILSGNAIFYTYALYLIAKHRFNASYNENMHLTSLWFFYASLISLYTGSFESTVENHLNTIKSLKTLDEYKEFILSRVNERLTNDYFDITLVGSEGLAVSGRGNNAWNAYVASLNIMNAKILFSKSNLLVSKLFEPGTDGNRKSLEKHHLFPKAYLKSQGYSDAKINQMANYAFIDWKDNMDILDDAPSVYYPIVCAGLSDEQIRVMEEENALPHGWENMAYEDFLIERRKLMAAKIKAAFEILKKAAT